MGNNILRKIFHKFLIWYDPRKYSGCKVFPPYRPTGDHVIYIFFESNELQGLYNWCNNNVGKCNKEWVVCGTELSPETRMVDFFWFKRPEDAVAFKLKFT